MEISTLQEELNVINAALPIPPEEEVIMAAGVVEAVVIIEEVVAVDTAGTVVVEGAATMVVVVVGAVTTAVEGVVTMDLAAAVIMEAVVAAVEEAVLMVAERIAVMLRFLLQCLHLMVAQLEITHLPQIPMVEIPLMVLNLFLQLPMAVVGPIHTLLRMALLLQAVMVVMDLVICVGAVEEDLQQDLMVGMVVPFLVGMGVLPLVILVAAAVAAVTPLRQ